MDHGSFDWTSSKRALSKAEEGSSNVIKEFLLAMVWYGAIERNHACKLSVSKLFRSNRLGDRTKNEPSSTKVAVFWSRQDEVLAQGFALVVAPKQTAPLQFRNHLRAEIVESAGQVRELHGEWRRCRWTSARELRVSGRETKQSKTPPRPHPRTGPINGHPWRGFRSLPLLFNVAHIDISSGHRVAGGALGG
jgi:hypothetical protein